MKKYFTKYLPIEGELNKDDFYFSYKDGLLYKWLPSQTRHEGDKKAKLFLCSRDIQVGDEVQNDEVKGICESTTPSGLLRLRINKEFYTEVLDGFFKVIREIPIEDTWIKEGMEFDEKDFNVLSQSIEQSLKRYKKELGRNPDSIFYKGLIKNTEEYLKEIKDALDKNNNNQKHRD